MQVMKWSVIALAVAAGSTQMAVASSQSESKGFIEDSSLQLLNKNYFFYRDFRNNPSDRQNYRKEWAHGISAMYESGFTQGTVRSEEHTSELQSQSNLVCTLLLVKRSAIRKKLLTPRSTHQAHFLALAGIHT